MEHLSKTLKTAALAGLFGLGVAGATPALAHSAYSYCDRDGDTCVRVVCDDDGDNCRRVTYQNPNRYYRQDYWNNGYGNDYWRRGDAYGRRSYRSCDSDADRCQRNNYQNEDDDD